MNIRNHPAIENSLSIYITIIRVFCGFDNDEAGHLNTDRMMGLHSSIIRMVPAGKDWNSDLR